MRSQNGDVATGASADVPRIDTQRSEWKNGIYTRRKNKRGRSKKYRWKREIGPRTVSLVCRDARPRISAFTRRSIDDQPREKETISSLLLILIAISRLPISSACRLFFPDCFLSVSQHRTFSTPPIRSTRDGHLCFSVSLFSVIMGRPRGKCYYSSEPVGVVKLGLHYGLPVLRRA